MLRSHPRSPRDQSARAYHEGLMRTGSHPLVPTHRRSESDRTHGPVPSVADPTRHSCSGTRSAADDHDPCPSAARPDPAAAASADATTTGLTRRPATSGAAVREYRR